MILRFLQASEGGMGGCPLRPGRRLLTLPLWCPQEEGGRTEPTRHWLDLPLWCPAGREC